MFGSSAILKIKEMDSHFSVSDPFELLRMGKGIYAIQISLNA